MAARLAPTLLTLAALIAVGGPAAAAVSNGNHQTPGANPGSTVQTMSEEDTEIAALKADVAKLTQQVGTLQSQLTALQNNVAAFHTEFANHSHSFGPAGLGILTILKCAGYGQPCTSATPLPEITVFTPETGPGLTSKPVP